MAGRPKGLPKTGGRQKGVPNKINRDLKEMILGALDKAGGIEYLVKQSKEKPVAFLALVGRVLPMTVASDPQNPLLTGITVTLVQPEHPDT
ncbi:hypothetical protein [Stenotrophomonas maltophilia]|uniref:hypothetical protein n=1 Tax=Stenotrophomonas maltophilia TaxID=40324 RepID=UPI0007F92649|nr:hypothetical protein [Stenotrophomonas maltophilia]OBU59185.1 hypothetical protein A9K70_01290 [Stenotrophomonas maltophilia]